MISESNWLRRIFNTLSKFSIGCSHTFHRSILFTLTRERLCGRSCVRLYVARNMDEVRLHARGRVYTGGGRIVNKRRSRVCKVTSVIFVHNQRVASDYGLIVTTGDRPSVIEHEIYYTWRCVSSPRFDFLESRDSPL